MGTWQSVVKKIERNRAKVGKKKSFDFSYLDFIKKNFPTNPESGRPFVCKWCTKPMYMAGINRRNGSITLSCESDECIGNVDTPERIVKRKLKELKLDTKLNFNGRKGLLDVMTNQRWMTKYTPP